jgi:hypothetical protein
MLCAHDNSAPSTTKPNYIPASQIPPQGRLATIAIPITPNLLDDDIAEAAARVIGVRVKDMNKQSGQTAPLATTLDF